MWTDPKKGGRDAVVPVSRLNKRFEGRSPCPMVGGTCMLLSLIRILAGELSHRGINMSPVDVSHDVFAQTSVYIWHSSI